MFKIKALVLIGVLVISGTASSDVIPSSYVSTDGDGDSYMDDTGKQLADGLIGDNLYYTDFGNGAAYEWVGWMTANPTINFKFDTPVKLSQVLIGFNRHERYGVFLPKTVTIAGKSFALKGTEIGDWKRGFLKFNAPFNGTDLTITLKDDDSNRWIFVDEIKFISPAIQGTAPWVTAHTVICQNTTQNKTVTIPKTKSSAWNCEKAGLAVKSGDKVKVTIEGTKY
ncbi:MAG: hypothetical protein Q8N96_09270 [Methylovulum sp.]|nr:hypothetical protein [Methylovulum sp.]